MGAPHGDDNTRDFNVASLGQAREAACPRAVPGQQVGRLHASRYTSAARTSGWEEEDGALYSESLRVHRTVLASIFLFTLWSMVMQFCMYYHVSARYTISTTQTMCLVTRQRSRSTRPGKLTYTGI